MCLEEGKLPELAFDWFVFACVHQTASRHQAMRADETDISWLNMLAKPQPPCISKLPWRQCVPAKKAPRSSRSGDRTLSDFQPLHPNSVKYRGDYNQTQSLLWALAEPTINATHTHRSGEVTCRVFSRSSGPESASCWLFLHSQVCVTRLGSVQRGHFIPFCLLLRSLTTDTPRITFGSKAVF